VIISAKPDGSSAEAVRAELDPSALADLAMRLELARLPALCRPPLSRLRAGHGARESIS
jgi:hypothetical protein